MHNVKSLVSKVAGGFLIGLGFIIPGVSGAVLAVILGLYEPILQAVAKPLTNFRQNLSLLLTVGLGAATSFLLLSRLLRFIFAHYPILTLYLFFGLVLGSLPGLLRLANSRGFRLSYIICLGLGFFLLLGAFKTASVLSFHVQFGPSWQGLLLLGAVIGVAVVIPGLSVSFILLAFGSYELVLDALAEPNLAILVPLALGVLLTVSAASRLITYALAEFYGFSTYFVLGLLGASLVLAFPGWPRTRFELVLASLLGVLGIIVSSWFSTKTVST